MRSAREFLQPLAAGAPMPLTEIPTRAARMIHFFDPSSEKMRARVPDMLGRVDVLLGNLEDAIPIESKEAARNGLIEIARSNDFADTQLWTRVNSLDSPWFLDDMIDLVDAIGDRLDVIMLPKVNGPWDIQYVDQLLAQLEARRELPRPILLHAILETATGVANVEEIATASPRMQGMSLGPSDLAASRRMKTTRVGGPHPDYIVRSDPHPANPTAPRATFMQDPWHYTLARMIDACAGSGIFPFYGPFGDFSDDIACEDQFRDAFILGCVGAWTLHPRQIAIARRVFRPDPDTVDFARRVVAAIEGGSGVAVVDGKMQDDATYKQARVLLETAELIGRKDPEVAALYGM